MSNTLGISFFKLLIGFPAAIGLAVFGRIGDRCV